MQALPTIALSVMTAAQTRLGVSAHNLANLATDGFRRQVVHAEAAPSGGVRTELGTSALAGNALERDLVAQMQAKNEFMASLMVFRTADAMAGSLLDIRA